MIVQQSHVQTSNMNSLRFYDIDAMRSVLMMLSLMLHAAAIYATNRPNITSNLDRNDGFAWLINGLHLGITPSFFVVSAFFFAMMLSKYSWQTVALERIRRLLLPTLCIALTFNIAELYWRYKDSGGNLNFLPFLQSAAFQDRLRSGAWQLHLWFMADLLAFVFIILAIAALLPRAATKTTGLAKTLGQQLARPIAKPAGLLMLLMMLASISTLACGIAARLPFGYTLILPGFVSLYGLAQYMPYFMFGLLLQASEPLRCALLKFRPWMPILMILGFIIQPYPDPATNFWFQAPLIDHVDRQGVMMLAQYMISWIMIIGGLQLFHRFFNVDRPWQRRWAGRAQSVYLFHHALVYAGGMMLVQVQLPPLAEWSLLAVVVVFTVKLMHDQLVVRSALIALLFNGRRLPPLRDQRAGQRQTTADYVGQAPMIIFKHG
jgi:glucans biosynthesis protein C